LRSHFGGLEEHVRRVPNESKPRAR
jgi:hypothetical protein